MRRAGHILSDLKSCDAALQEQTEREQLHALCCELQKRSVNEFITSPEDYVFEARELLAARGGRAHHARS